MNKGTTVGPVIQDLSAAFDTIVHTILIDIPSTLIWH